MGTPELRNCLELTLADFRPANVQRVSRTEFDVRQVSRTDESLSRAFAQQEHAPVDRIARASAARCASAILRSFTDTPPCCTSRRASLFDAPAHARHQIDDAQPVAVELRRGNRRRRHIVGNRQQRSATLAASPSPSLSVDAPNSTAFADSARVASSAPCTSVVTSIARARAAPRASPARASPARRASSISSRVEEREELQVARSTSRSSVFSQN